ncbi:MAG: hypothetical protein LBS31_10480 [Candidatus Adiutrix sp.]|jgi:hypothetical protein|nr:hypothetical protein [Candidatus Adiutrix sp.]
MLIHPEVYAWLNRQSNPEIKEGKRKPLVTRGTEINKGGSEKARETRQYAADAAEREDEVEYLNDKSSNLNFYA